MCYFVVKAVNCNRAAIENTSLRSDETEECGGLRRTSDESGGVRGNAEECGGVRRNAEDIGQDCNKKLDLRNGIFEKHHVLPVF